MKMIPLGYMAKRVKSTPVDWMKNPVVQYIAALSSHISEDFMDYISEWRHNGHWLFDRPEIIQELIAQQGIDPQGLTYFYYEASELEYDLDEQVWLEWSPETSFQTNVKIPEDKRLLGYDVVTYSMGTSPECSYLSCNAMAEECDVNAYCLFQNFNLAKRTIESGIFDECEPGPCRIVAVYLLAAYNELGLGG